jgi:hypothetical protein
MKIFDVVVCGLAFASLGYFGGALTVVLWTHRKFWLMPKEK